MNVSSKWFSCVLPCIWLAGLSLSIVAQSSRQTSNWSIENGWALRDGEKYFAVGTWHIPGYEYVLAKDKEPTGNDEKFAEAASIYNFIYVQIARDKLDYMGRDHHDAVLAAGWGHLHYRFKRSGLPSKEGIRLGPHIYSNDDEVVDYPEMKTLRDALAEPSGLLALTEYLQESVVDEIYLKREWDSRYDFVWLVADEPDAGKQNGWFWHPDLLKIVHDLIFARDPDQSTRQLTFIDLFGHITGNKYLFEQAHLKNIGRMPASLPVPLPGRAPDQSIRKLEGNPKDTKRYKYAAYDDFKSVLPAWTYDGKPPHDLDRDSNWDKTDFFSLPNHHEIFFENIQETAAGYGKAADVLGVNTYSEFASEPYLAGLTVDAIRAGAGAEKPVWLFYDGATDANAPDRKGLPNVAYIKNVRAQIYTAITRGASGALFWQLNTQAFPPKQRTLESYQLYVKQLAMELRNNTPILIADVVEFGRDTSNPHMHYSRRRADNREYLIVVNSHPAEEGKLELAGFPEISLGPLDVRIFGPTSDCLVWTKGQLAALSLKENAVQYVSAELNTSRNFTLSEPGTSFVNADIGDFNGDGRDDVLVRTVDATFEAYVGEGRRSSSTFEFTFVDPGHVWQSEGKRAAEVAIGDFNGDGYEDVMLRDSVGTLQPMFGDRLLGRNGAGFQPGSSFRAWSSAVRIEQMAVGDFNADACSDIALCNDGVLLKVYFGNPQVDSNEGAFSEMDEFNGWAQGDLPIGQMIVGDFNGDGFDDLALRTNGRWVKVRLGNSSLGFGDTPFDHVAGFEVWDERLKIHKLLADDFDGDGSDDLLVSGEDRKRIQLFFGASYSGDREVFGNTWNDSATTHHADEIVHIGTGDVNGDGNSDILLIEQNGSVKSYLANGNGRGGPSFTKREHVLPAGSMEWPPSGVLIGRFSGPPARFP